MQMIAVIPPATWCEMWGTPPQVLIEAARETEHHRELLEGWARAAARHRDREWAEALLSTSIPSLPEGVAAELVDPLPPERRSRAPSHVRSGNRSRWCRGSALPAPGRDVHPRGDRPREHSGRATSDWRIHAR